MPVNGCPAVVITHNRFHLLFVNIKVVMAVGMSLVFVVAMKEHNVKWLKTGKMGVQKWLLTSFFKVAWNASWYP